MLVACMERKVEEYDIEKFIISLVTNLRMIKMKVTWGGL